MDEHLSSEQENPTVAHEERDINVRAFMWFVVGFIIFAAVTHVLLYFMFGWFRDAEDRQQKEPVTRVQIDQPLAPPEPQLQADPPTDMINMRREQEQWLHSYGWMDREGGKVRIPIDRAMQLTVRNKLIQAAAEAGGELPPSTGEASEASPTVMAQPSPAVQPPATNP